MAIVYIYVRCLGSIFSKGSYCTFLKEQATGAAMVNQGSNPKIVVKIEGFCSQPLVFRKIIGFYWKCPRNWVDSRWLVSNPNKPQVQKETHANQLHIIAPHFHLQPVFWTISIRTNNQNYLNCSYLRRFCSGTITRLEFSIAPEKWCSERYLPFGM